MKHLRHLQFLNPSNETSQTFTVPKSRVPLMKHLRHLHPKSCNLLKLKTISLRYREPCLILTIIFSLIYREPCPILTIIFSLIYREPCLILTIIFRFFDVLAFREFNYLTITFKLFGFLSFGLWAYMMKVIPDIILTKLDISVFIGLNMISVTMKTVVILFIFVCLIIV
jgi:hypothetical protein